MGKRTHGMKPGKYPLAASVGDRTVVAQLRPYLDGRAVAGSCSGALDEEALDSSGTCSGIDSGSDDDSCEKIHDVATSISQLASHNYFSPVT